MSVPVWFTVLFSGTGLTIIICFAFQYGVFGECCQHSNDGTPVGTDQSTRHRVGVGVGDRGGSPRSEGMGSSQVSTARAESEEEGAHESSETESGRSGGLSSDERSEEDEDWRGTV